MKAKKLVIKSVYEKPVKLNGKGLIVKEASMLLRRHGSELQVTDVFNIGMRSAVISFQKKNKLAVTGKIDKKTWNKLLKADGVQVA